MRPILFVLLLQALAAPDPAQMEKAPDLGYVAVQNGLRLPEGTKLGVPDDGPSRRLIRQRARIGWWIRIRNWLPCRSSS